MWHFLLELIFFLNNNGMMENCKDNSLITKNGFKLKPFWKPSSCPMGNCFASKRFWVQTPFGQWNLRLPFLKYGIINSEYNTKFSQIFVFLKKRYLWPNISHFNIVLCLCGFFVLNKASATFFGENLFQNKKGIPWTIICTWTIVFIMIFRFSYYV